MGQFHRDPDGHRELMRAEVPEFGRASAELAPGGRLVVGDVVLPEDPADEVTPIDEGYDMPSRVDEQLGWMAAAGLRPQVAWSSRDLAVLVGRE